MTTTDVPSTPCPSDKTRLISPAYADADTALLSLLPCAHGLPLKHPSPLTCPYFALTPKLASLKLKLGRNRVTYRVGAATEVSAYMYLVRCEGSSECGKWPTCVAGHLGQMLAMVVSAHRAIQAVVTKTLPAVLRACPCFIRCYHVVISSFAPIRHAAGTRAIQPLKVGHKDRDL